MTGFDRIAKARPRGTDAIDHGDSVTWVRLRSGERLARFVRVPSGNRTRLAAVLPSGERLEHGSGSLSNFLEAVASRAAGTP